MEPKIALTLCVIFILVILRIEQRWRDQSTAALWLPTIWMLIYASRPISRWLGWYPSTNIEAGSPLDRFVLTALMIFALLVLQKRRIEWSVVIKDNFWLILLIIYMGLSILWSDFAYVSLKRWIRFIGDILMAMLILTEKKPLEGLESILRRCAYILMPLSLVLIKYYPQFGRAYGRWDGLPMWTGVTTHKNSLGQLCALVAFFLFWSLLRDWQSNQAGKRRSRTFVDGLVLALSLFQLKGSGYSYSATSVGILIVSIACLLILDRKRNLARRITANLKALTLVGVAMFLLFADAIVKAASNIFGRDPTLTGRTVDIWQPLFAIGSKRFLFGAGYGGFWGLESPDLGILQAHNGYLDIYLELGIVGMIMFSCFILSFCNRITRVIDYSFEWGVYGVCFLIISLMYNYSESSFLQSLSSLWSTMVFLTIVFSVPILSRDKDVFT